MPTHLPHSKKNFSFRIDQHVYSKFLINRESILLKLLISLKIHSAIIKNTRTGLIFRWLFGYLIFQTNFLACPFTDNNFVAPSCLINCTFFGKERQIIISLKFIYCCNCFFLEIMTTKVPAMFYDINCTNYKISILFQNSLAGLNKTPYSVRN